MPRSSRFEFSHPDIAIDRGRLAAIIAGADAAKSANAAMRMKLIVDSDNGRVAPQLDPVEVQKHTDALGSRLIEFHSENKTVAASMIAEKKVSGHRSYRVATRRQSFRRPNMISMRLRRL